MDQDKLTDAYGLNSASKTRSRIKTEQKMQVVAMGYGTMEQKDVYILKYLLNLWDRISGRNLS
jgi:hypothetical protein